MIAHRLFRFPEIIDEFWRTHYVLYRDEVMVPGRQIHGFHGERQPFEVIVPGAYRWIVNQSSSPRLAVDENVGEQGARWNLNVGVHELALLDDVSAGIFALAVKDSPERSTAPFSIG